jgi:hypothetical protein
VVDFCEHGNEPSRSLKGGKGREGKGREGKGREGKGREGKGREELRLVSHVRIVSSSCVTIVLTTHTVSVATQVLVHDVNQQV